LDRLLRRNARDVDARLLSATLLRRTGRTAEARRSLDEMERWAGVEKWRSEIRREREYLDAVDAAGISAADIEGQTDQGRSGTSGMAQAA
jgi:hypothetical protein